jgi:hypothetical protein
MRRDVVPRVCFLLFGHVRVFAIPELLVVLHLLLQALEAGGVSGQIFALVLDDRGLRMARVNFSCLDRRVSWRLSRVRLDGVDVSASTA